jgi:chemotaxis protein CheY-P-specific phosphatase CheC
MRKSAEEITKQFLRSLFGKLIADIIFQQKLEKFNIGSYSSLTTSEKVEFGHRIIKDTFDKFYPNNKIENMQVLYLMRFSMNEAAIRVEEMIHRECDINLSAPEEINAVDIKQVFESIQSDKNVKFVFEWTHMLEGDLVIILDQDTALKFSKIFMQAMMGIESEDDQLDEMKLSAINEFFNIILPVFSKVIGDSFKEVIFFTPRTYAEFVPKYYYNNEFVIPQKMIHTNISFMIDGVNNTGELFFFIKESAGRFKELLDQAQLYKDPFEESPPRIFARVTGNTMADMIEFFKLMKIPTETVDYLLDSIYKPNFTHFEYSDYIKFYQHLMNEFLPNASENKKDVIKLNLAHILGMSR